MSPFLQKAGITLNIVDIPYEYRMESGVPRKVAIFFSQSRCTSARVPHLEDMSTFILAIAVKYWEETAYKPIVP
jgi:hypothetical protein